MTRRVITAREQLEMLSPWRRVAEWDEDAAWAKWEQTMARMKEQAAGLKYVTPHPGKTLAVGPNWSGSVPDGHPTRIPAQAERDDIHGYLDHDEDGHVTFVYTSPMLRGNGVASKLLDHAGISSTAHAYQFTADGRKFFDSLQKKGLGLRTATPWHSTPGDPTYSIPTPELKRYRQFNPSIETPQDMHDSLWTRNWGADDSGEKPEYRRWKNDNFSSGGGDEGGTEEEMVEGFESGAKFPPVEITTNGHGALLTDGNHRVNTADTLSRPALDSYIHYDPHQYDDSDMADEIDPQSELARHVDKLVQNHPYKPLGDKMPTTKYVFRQHPETGRWQRGTADTSTGAQYVDTPDYLEQMKQLVPGFKDQGLGTYWDVDWGNGPESTNGRLLHARRTAGPVRILYHHTSPESAEAIRANGFMNGLEKGQRPDAVFFSTRPDSEYAQAFGQGQVQVHAPEHLFDDDTGEFNGENAGWLDDEFPSGEQHWAIPAKHIRKEWIR